MRSARSPASSGRTGNATTQIRAEKRRSGPREQSSTTRAAGPKGAAYWERYEHPEVLDILRELGALTLPVVVTSTGHWTGTALPPDATP